MARVVAFVGVFGWLVAVVLFASAIEWAGTPRVVPGLVMPPPLVRELNGARRARPGEAWWAVKEATSAHSVLVVDVETSHVDQSRIIAAEIVGPAIKRKYLEVLVYVWEAGANRPFADRRVQWTPRDGYTELSLTP